jgi:hypothetical protein
MPISASYLAVLLGAGTLFSGPLSMPPLSPAPSDSRPAGPKPDDATLPPPRVDAPTQPPLKSEAGRMGTIVEEPAPAPHEQTAGSVAGPVPVLLPQQFREEPAPMPREQTPMPGRFWMPGAPRDASLADVESLHREIESLRLEREAMLAEETDLITAKDMHSAKKTDANLQKQIAELMVRVAQQAKKASETASGPPPSTAKSKPVPSRPRQAVHADGQGGGSHQQAETGPVPIVLPDKSLQPVLPSASAKKPDDNVRVITDAPVDPLALAQSLFRMGNHAEALKAYRKLDKEDQKPEDRTAIQYMMACCLRKLGKLDEASVLYREVANSPGNDFLMENAQWYLRTTKERRELEAQLEELRQRRQALKPRKS